MDALYNRAFTFKVMGDYENALRDAEQIIELEPGSAPHWNLKGNVHLLFGDYNLAIESYTEAMDLDFRYPEAPFNRGLAYIMSNRPIQGCQDLRQSLSLGFDGAQDAFNNFCGN